MSSDRELPDIQAGLRQLGETTTAADLVRQRGQTKKVTVISERRLKEWIEAILSQFRAGQEDAFSDVEKQQMLTRTQEELAKRIKREQEASAERDRLKAELDHAMQVVAEARSGQAAGVDIDAALNDLRAQLEARDRIINDLQDENFELQDQLREKVELIGATISEKDKLRGEQQRLRDTIKAQMLHAGDLVQGVLQLDEAHYGGRHETEVPEGEDDAAFYRDFAVGAKVIDSLGSDLGRLREFAREHDERGEATQGLLAEDLALLADLKAGKLEASDVAAPVESLAEALRGAREEASALDQAVAQATGAALSAPLPPAPEGDGEPAQVLADATTLVRDLTVQLVLERRRIIALSQMAADADVARNEGEEEVTRLRKAFEDTVARLSEKADRARFALAESLLDQQADPATRAQAAMTLLDQLSDNAPINQAAVEQLELVDRLLSQSGAPVQTPHAAGVVADGRSQVAARLRDAGLALEFYAKELHTENQQLASELADAKATAIANGITSEDLARLRLAFDDTVAQLTQKGTRARLALAESLLDQQADPVERAQAAIRLLDQLTEESPVRQAAVEQLQLVDRLLQRNGAQAHAADVDVGDHAAVADRLRDAGLALETYSKQVHTENERLLAELALARAAGVAAGAQAMEIERLIRQAEDLRAAREQTLVELASAQQRITDIDAKSQQTQQATGVYRIQTQQQADLLVTARAEAERLRGELATQTAATRQAQAAAESAQAAARAAAQSVVSAAQGDHDLVEATTDLALELDGGDHAAVEVNLVPAIAALAERKTELAARVAAAEGARSAAETRLADTESRLSESAAELAENAASAKEVITQLSQGREVREKELRDLRERIATADSTAADQAARAAQAESTARALADALAHVVAAEPDRPAQAGDFEATVAQLPAEGEEGIPMAATTAAALADSGRRLAEAIVSKRREQTGIQSLRQADSDRIHQDLVTAQTRISELTVKVEQQSLAVRKEHAEREAVLRELTSQAILLAAKTQESAAARSEFASLQVDLDTTREQVAAIQTKAQVAEQDLDAAHQRLTTAEHALDEARRAAEAGERTRTMVSESLRLLPAAPGDAAVAALNRAEAAAAAGDRATASEHIGEAIRLRLAALTTDLDCSRQQAESAKVALEDTHAEAVALKAAAADRDQRVSNLEHEREDAVLRADQAAAAAAAAAARIAALESDAARLHQELDVAQDQVAELQGRTGFTAGSQKEEGERMRKALDDARSMIVGFAQERSEHKAAMVASEARQKRLREEFEARLTERDRQLQEKDRILDSRIDQSADLAELTAQVQDLETRLGTATKRVAELETLAGGSAGLAGRSGDLAREMKRMQEERKRLRDEQRRIEGELADARGQVDELQATVEEKRREVLSAQEQATAQIQCHLQDAEAARAETQRLHEEIAGLRSRLRRTER